MAIFIISREMKRWRLGEFLIYLVEAELRSVGRLTLQNKLIKVIMVGHRS